MKLSKAVYKRLARLGSPTIYNWQTPATDYPDRRRGKARVGRYKYTPGIYECYGVNGHKLYHVERTIPIRNLIIAGQVWMVDDPPHWWGMLEHATFYSGHVVCAGLGLGLIVHALFQNPQVKRITVLEREPDVVKLISPHVPKCEIITDDFWNWTGKPDGVFFDLFVGNGYKLISAAIRTMIMLRENFPTAQTIRIHGFNNSSLSSLP